MLNGSATDPTAGLKVPETLAIVGLGPTSLHYVSEVDHIGDRKKLYDETWTFNTYASTIQSDRIFHMDDVRVQEIRAKAGNIRVENMLEALKRYPNPIYTSFPEPEYPSMVSYPLAAVAAKFNTLYFTTTPPYALAYAGLIGVKRIYIYGCDYTWPGVAGAEGGRACMEFWIGLLKGHGIFVDVHPMSSLMDARLQHKDDIKLYGFDRVHLKLEHAGDNEYRLLHKPKPLPTAEEIEARYSHTVPGSGISVDVVS